MWSTYPCCLYKTGSARNSTVRKGITPKASVNFCIQVFLATRCDTIPDDRLADVDLNFFLARTLIGALPVRDTTVDNGYGTQYGSVAVCNGCYN